MNNSWKEILKEELNQEYFIELQKKVAQRRLEAVVFPPEEDTFTAFSINPEDIKVVILGQDPYHGKGQAHGLSFSVLGNQKLPPSLKNIYKNISAEFGYEMPKDKGDLTPWLNQGVFLLNSVMTVEEKTPGSHKNMGWEKFTDKVIEKLSSTQSGIVFMLWGDYSRKKVPLIDARKHCVLESPHPSPFSAHKGFFENKHFRLANEYLSKQGKSEIDWRI